VERYLGLPTTLGRSTDREYTRKIEKFSSQLGSEDYECGNKGGVCEICLPTDSNALNELLPTLEEVAQEVN
jgi:hypothetical protein